MKKLNNKIRKTSLASGFTLVELLVTMVVVLFLLMGFNKILVTSRNTVTNAQAYMDLDAKALAIDTDLRTTMRKFSKAGSLHLSNNVLTLVTAGPSFSTLNDEMGNGTIVTLGLCDERDAKTADYKVFYKLSRVLGGQAVGTTAKDDTIPVSLSEIQYGYAAASTASATYLAASNSSYIPIPATTDKLIAMPYSITELDDMWKVLAKSVKSLEITVSKPGSSAWLTSCSCADIKTAADWPTLVRFRYTLIDSRLEEDDQEQVYESIIPLY